MHFLTQREPTDYEAKVWLQADLVVREYCDDFDGHTGNRHPVDGLVLLFELLPNGFEVVTARTPNAGFNADNTKQATALCPAGKRVVGTGADIETDGGDVGGRVALERISPVSDREARAVAGEVANAGNLRWAVVVVAFCAYTA